VALGTRLWSRHAGVPLDLKTRFFRAIELLLVIAGVPLYALAGVSRIVAAVCHLSHRILTGPVAGDETARTFGGKVKRVLAQADDM